VPFAVFRQIVTGKLILLSEFPDGPNKPLSAPGLTFLGLVAALQRSASFSLQQLAVISRSCTMDGVMHLDGVKAAVTKCFNE
jgi:hypothetical protein